MRRNDGERIQRAKEFRRVKRKRRGTILGRGRKKGQYERGEERRGDTGASFREHMSWRKLERKSESKSCGMHL